MFFKGDGEMGRWGDGGLGVPTLWGWGAMGRWGDQGEILPCLPCVPCPQSLIPDHYQKLRYLRIA